MATHAIGKLKLNFSGGGAAFRWGDGAVHRLFGGRSSSKSQNNEYIEENQDMEAGQAFDDAYADDVSYADDASYDEYEDDAAYEDDPGYDDEYADEGYADDYDDGYADDAGYDDGYAEDDGYADDGYADDGYADDGYADDYDDGYADDGYDDGYEDDGYADEGYEDDGYGAYDDRYSDEDADGYGSYYASENPVLRYVDENDWVTYLLLFLLPPLGVYLLWRRNRFDKPVRYAVSAASLIWFVVALILIFSAIFPAGGRDVQKQPSISLAPVTATPAATAAADGDSAVSSAVDGTLGDGVEPSPTPLNSGAAAVSGYVYSPATGLYYHSREDCTNIPAGVAISRVLKDVAENGRRQSPCPVCIGGTDTTTYYATRGGKYYHVDATCSNMKSPLTYTKEAAEKEGKTPCPVCITKEMVSLDNNSVKFITSETVDQSRISVYATKDGKYFHVRSDCSGMKNAVMGSLKAALLYGKKACPNCCSAAGTRVYLTKNGKKYHLDPKCSGMKGATTVTLAEALVMGKAQCEVCIKQSLGFSPASVQAPSAGTAASNGAAVTTNAVNAKSSDEVYVYATKTGKYYHTNSTCSGMKNATRVTLKAMMSAKRTACPVCADNANTIVYATKNGTYYHSFAGCSGMKNAVSGTQAQALAAGYKRCPNCWTTSSSSSSSTAQTAAALVASKAAASGSNAVAVSSKATGNNTFVYATKNGSYYHSKSNCSGMKNAVRVSLDVAVRAGKTACPTCAAAANRYVYSTKDGKYYHAASVCKASGMKNGVKRTLAQALVMHQTACPKCIKSNNGSSLNKGTGVTMAALQKAAASQQASAAAKAKAAAAAAAQAKAAAQAQARATMQAKYNAALKALAQRKVANFRAGASGVKVYVALNGKYYHIRGNCDSSKYQRQVTLETAMNYGYSACPKCCTYANRTVYATKGGKYYHLNQTDAGVGAVKGTLSVALACGFKACPYCVTKTATLKKVANFTVGKSGIRVYATHENKYYHSRANCSGMKNASRITLETALNYGKKGCPVCLPQANYRVYAIQGDKYYHRYQSHAGPGARAGYLAYAKALGMKACPNCVPITAGSQSPTNGGVPGSPVSQVKYSAPGSSAVYINAATANNYYHKAAKCSRAGFSGGTKVTLRYVLDWGYKACPFCAPPTSAS